MRLQDSNSRGLLLIDHGSRRKEAHSQLLAIAERLAARFDATPSAKTVVEIAHMEIAEPSVAKGFDACVARGASRVVAIPCFLSRGSHVTEDIPALVAEAASRHPEVIYEVTAPLSEQLGFIELLVSAADSV
jgi:sirohydrochlorin ferrochelatase